MAVTWTFRQRLNAETVPGNLLYLGNGIVLCACISGKVYKSTDYGKTWSFLSDINPAETGGFTTLARLKSNSSLAIVFAKCCGAGGGTGGYFYKSEDGGLSWSEKALGILGSGGLAGYSHGTVCYLGNNIIGVTRAYGIQRSTDYGANWSQISYLPPHDEFWVTLINLGSGISIASSQVYDSNVAAIWRSTDYGANWIRVFQVDTLHVGGVLHCVIRLFDGSLLIALNRVLCRSTDNGQNWSKIAEVSEDDFGWLMNPSGNLVYALNRSAHILRSVDGGKTWIDEGQVEAETIGYKVSKMEGTDYVANFTNARIYTTEILFPEKPTDLLCEGEKNPTVVKVLNPRFSAIYHGPEIGDHCQIQVNTSSNFSGTEMWDSGKIEIPDVSDKERCKDITYAGSTLTPGVSYYWRIKFWDDKGLEGAWSTEPAYFIMEEEEPPPPEREKPIDAVGKVKKARLPLLTRRRQLIWSRLITPPIRVILDP